MTPRSMMVSQIAYAEQVRPEIKPIGLSTMAVGQITDPHQAETILRQEKADLIAVGREMLFNPNWALHTALAMDVDPSYALWPRQYGSWLERRELLDLDERS